MPVLSEKQLSDLGSTIRKGKETVARIRKKAEERTGRVKDFAETAAGGLVGGYLSHRLGDQEGMVSVFGFRFNPALAIGAGLGIGGLFEIGGKYSEDMINLGGGMVAGYAYEFGAKTGANAKAAGTMFGAEIPYGEPKILGPSAGMGTPSNWHMGAEVDPVAESLVGGE